MDISGLFQAFSTPRRAQSAAVDASLLVSARRQWVTHDNLELAGLCWGSAGPKVLLVHGWESCAIHLGGFVEPLLGAGFQVYAFDAPAHGDSQGKTASVFHIGRALLAIAQKHGPFDGLVAHSVGSPAALYAFRYGMTVKASVHVAGPSSLERVLGRLSETVGLDSSDFQRLRAMVEAHAGTPIAEMELENLAPALKHAGLLLHDPQDGEVPFTESVILRAAWPQARLAEVHGSGHRRIISHPQTIKVALDHLKMSIANPSISHSRSNA